MAHLSIENHIVSIKGPGTLLVTSDLHGNLADFHRMVSLFEAEQDAVLLLLGDLFHGPSVTEDEWEVLYAHLADYYPDESVQLSKEYAALRRAYPTRVASLMGNHDHAHIGGPIVSKFWPDEAGEMESHMDAEGLEELQELVRAMALIGVSDCGVAFTHGATPDLDFNAEALRNIDFGAYRDVPLYAMYRYDLLGALLWRRGATEEVSRRFLDNLAAFTEPRCNSVVHGHEIADQGYVIENTHMLNLSTSFGMKAKFKTYLRLDLGATYDNAEAMRPGVELLPLID